MQRPVGCWLLPVLLGECGLENGGHGAFPFYRGRHMQSAAFGEPCPVTSVSKLYMIKGTIQQGSGKTYKK
jgi:hypothetical protein